jgi:hypothetical protein
MHIRRRGKSAIADELSSFTLTADEEARLERLLAAEPAPDKPA